MAVANETVTAPPVATDARRRRVLFAALCAVCVLVAGGFIAWAVIRDGGAGSSVGGPIGDGGAPGSLAGVSGASGALMFQNVVSGDYWNQVGLVPMGHPEGSRSMMPLRCRRVHFAAGRGLCLAEGNGPPGTYAAYIFDSDLRVTGDVDLAGLPSRTRVSPDARYGATTAFVSGHSYAEEGYSTQTLLIDLANGKELANLEEFTAYRNGEAFANEDFNYWGVTFTEDSNRFYASLGTGGKTYLVQGDIAERTVEVLRENVECPSISPDNTRIAFKKKVGGDLAGPIWRFHVLDLATMAETPLAETRSIDDQIMWLDNDEVLYGDGQDTWEMAADGSGQPRRFMSKAVSVTVVDGMGEADVASSPAGQAGDVLTLPETDLSVSVDVPETVTAGVELTYNVTVTNNGPHEATWLVVDAYLPEDAQFGGTALVEPVNMDHGCSYFEDEDRVRCDTATLAAGARWTFAVTVTPRAEGPGAVWANAGATENDPNPANDHAEATFTIGP
ncbi:MAG TPA: DUF11 domain-containing protein [Thermomicrobiales bacterium]|nr:DUF11 domain-containing protein [Thermomicrobiales bacterium]